MEVLELQTDLHCEKCVARIKPHFDQDPKIKSWTVGLDTDIDRKIKKEWNINGIDTVIALEKV